MTREIIAILRGIQPKEIETFADILIESGISKIEIPLNSPYPFLSIQKLVRHCGKKAICGAGTVLTCDEVKKLSDIGAQMVVSPHCDLAVIQETKAQNMLSYPGVLTPTECFSALAKLADGLKIFPGNIIGADGLKSLMAVLPQGVKCFAVGGANIHNFKEWLQAGAAGFGIGSALYKAGMGVHDFKENARNIVTAYDKATAEFA